MFITFKTFASCGEMSTLVSEIIDLAHQKNDKEELLADETLTHIKVISVVTDNEKNVDSEESDYKD